MTIRTGTIALLAGLLSAGLATSATAQDPEAQPDRSWIQISGTVEAVTPDAFTLDYGEGVVTVEMDDGDRDADAYKLIEGDEVTVSGRVDDDLYETATIEASSVYVEKLGTWFYASAVDEEDALVTVVTPIVTSRITVQGVVTAVSDEEFVIDTGTRSLTVELDALGYDPLDDEGYQRIDVGDVVSVTGSMDADLFEGRELVADSVVTIAG